MERYSQIIFNNIHLDYMYKRDNFYRNGESKCNRQERLDSRKK